jgi:hypothetical protein
MGDIDAHKVLDGEKDLLEVDPANLWAELACFRQKLKQLSSLCEFEDDEWPLFLRS